jgi:hypothetical protein
VPARSLKMKPGVLVSYIRQRVRDGALNNWTMVLISNSQAGDETLVLGGCQVGVIQRQFIYQDPERVSVRRLLSPRDEALDLTPEEQQICFSKSVDGAPKKFLPSKARELRGAERGLVLIYPVEVYPGKKVEEEADNDRDGLLYLQTTGLAVSFPEDSGALPVDYAVNETYWDNEFGEDENEFE